MRKKESISVESINKAIELIDKANAMGPGDPGWQKAITEAQTAANAAGMQGQQVQQMLNVTSSNKDTQNQIDAASKDLGDSLQIIANDTTDAVDRLNSASEIAKNVFDSMGVVDPKTTRHKIKRIIIKHKAF